MHSALLELNIGCFFLKKLFAQRMSDYTKLLRALLNADASRAHSVRHEILSGDLKHLHTLMGIRFFRTVLSAQVGIDVPEASIVVIYHANNFGLAQLHQFRGRVGRGKRASRCFLVCTGEDNQQKVNLLEREHNGFKIAEADLQTRQAFAVELARPTESSQLTYTKMMAKHMNTESCIGRSL